MKGGDILQTAQSNYSYCSFSFSVNLGNSTLNPNVVFRSSKIQIRFPNENYLGIMIHNDNVRTNVGMSKRA